MNLNSECPIETLPNEVLSLILDLLGVYSLFARVVCKQWYSLINFDDRYIGLQDKILEELSDAHCLKYIILHNYPLLTRCKWNPKISSGLGKSGSLEELKWFQDSGYRIDTERLAKNAAKYGNLNLLKYIGTNLYLENLDIVLAASLKYKNTHLIEWLQYHRVEPTEKVCVKAAKYGHLEMLKLAKEKGCKLTADVCHFAAHNGHLHILKWARKNDCPWNEFTCSHAALNGHLNVLIWVRENECKWNHHVYLCAAKNGHFDIIKWAYENDCPYGDLTMTTIMENAAISGNLEIIKWAYQKNSLGLTTTMSHNATENGHLHVLQWMIDNGYELDSFICTIAAKKGHLHILKWCRKIGVGWKTLSFRIEAARNGYLNILKWSMECGFSWNGIFCLEAVKNNHLNIIKWAIENNYPIDDNVWISAIEAGNILILKYAIQNKYISLDKLGLCNQVNKRLMTQSNNKVLQYAVNNDLFFLTENLYSQAVSYDCADVLKYIKRMNPSFQPKSIETDEGRELYFHRADVLKWLIENKYPISYNEYRLIRINCNRDILKWFDSQKIPSFYYWRYVLWRIMNSFGQVFWKTGNFFLEVWENNTQFLFGTIIGATVGINLFIIVLAMKQSNKSKN